MLTVKVTGDGKDFGTYRRKAWQISPLIKSAPSDSLVP